MTAAHVYEVVAAGVATLGGVGVVLHQVVKTIDEGPGVKAWRLGKKWRVLVTNQPVETPPVDVPGSLDRFTKRCRGCWQVKAFAAFPSDRTTRDGLKPLCYPCWDSRGTLAAVKRVWTRGV